jgi:hypothetical protein
MCIYVHMYCTIHTNTNTYHSGFICVVVDGLYVTNSESLAFSPTAIGEASSPGSVSRSVLQSPGQFSVRVSV